MTPQEELTEIIEIVASRDGWKDAHVIGQEDGRTVYQVEAEVGAYGVIGSPGDWQVCLDHDGSVSDDAPTFGSLRFAMDVADDLNDN